MKKIHNMIVCGGLLFALAHAGDRQTGCINNALAQFQQPVLPDRVVAAGQEQKWDHDEVWAGQYESWLAAGREQETLRQEGDCVAHSSDLQQEFARIAAEFKTCKKRSNSLDQMLQTVEPVISDWRSLQDPFSAAHNLFFTSQYDQAIADYMRLIQAGGGTAEQVRKAHIGLGESLLALGSLVDGFAQREYRIAGQGYNLDRLWNGQDCLNGKTLLIRPEGGFGDIAFFQLRYVPLIQKFFPACRIILEGNFPQQSIYKLLKNVTIVKTGDCKEYDYAVYGMSLPRFLSTNGPIPTDVQSMPKGPYLKGDALLVQLYTVYFQTEFLNKGLLPIGIFWEASANPGGVFRVYDRNIDPDLLINALAQCKNVGLFNLQGPGSEAVAARHQGTLVTFDDLDKKSGPFQDTVALMEALKLIGGLVVGVDTGALNFAGAVGVETIALLPEYADWRWGVEQEISVWFPTMQLIRQKRQGDWSTVITEMQERVALAQREIERKHAEIIRAALASSIL